MLSVHKSVLLHEVVRSLTEGYKKALPSSIWYLDGTLGGAGHALGIAEVFKSKINIIGLDRDEQAISRAKEKLSHKVDRLILENENFVNLDKVLERNSLKSVDLILFDLGISSDELEHSGRGFSFLKDEPLLMTMGEPKKYIFTAKDIVNNWEEDVIANILYGYAGERFARRIARNIVVYRAKKKIETSGELAEIVKMSVPGFYRRGKIHPATKTFQALRIAVNDELGSLRGGLQKGFESLSSGGRMAVISFHSGEDRIVKNFYKEKSKQALIITKKPIVPSEKEIEENPRSRSAKLRIIEKI